MAHVQIGIVNFRCFGLCRRMYSQVIIVDQTTWTLVTVINCLYRMGQSFILGRFLRSFNDSEQTRMIYVYAAALVLSSALLTMIEHNQIFQMRHLAMRTRLAINSILYQKVFISRGAIQDEFSRNDFDFAELALESTVAEWCDRSASHQSPR